MGASVGGGGGGGGNSSLPQIAGAEGTNVNADINMTPMIDIMLVLLIIFMILTPAMGAAVKLPTAANVIPQKDEDRITLAIEKDGKFYLEDKPVAPNALAAALKQVYQARPEDHVLYLKADRSVQYSLVLTAINHARDAGVRKIGAITDAPKAASAAK